MPDKILSGRQSNCLNTIRLLAALQVVYDHVITHLSVSVPGITETVFGYFQGVPVFFIISGFLIWQSAGNSKSYKTYLKKRFLRIYPELWVAVFVEIVVILAAYRDYILKQLLLFAVGQASILQFWTPDSLRGYGCGTPNGSLWTIGVLIQFYIVVWFVKKVLGSRKISVWALAVGVSLILGMVPGLCEGYIPEIVLKLYSQTIPDYMYLFLTGAFLAEYKDRLLPYVTRYWYALFLTGIVFYVTGLDIPYLSYGAVKNLLSVYGLIGFAYRFPKINIKTDVSYGLYLYHMTVVNLMITLGMTGKVVFLFVAIIVSLVLAFASTETIGMWSAKKKAKLYLPD